jgi:hypothetical protein
MLSSGYGVAVGLAGFGGDDVVFVVASSKTADFSTRCASVEMTWLNFGSGEWLTFFRVKGQSLLP